MAPASVFVDRCCMDFGENLANFDLERENSDIFVTCRLYSFRPATQKFEQSATKVGNCRICVYRDQDSRVQCQILDYQTLKLAETQQSFPFLLLKLWCPGSKRPAIYPVFGLTVVEEMVTFSALGNPVAYGESQEKDWGPKLANGPSVLWQSKGTFHVERYEALAGVKSWKINIGSDHRVISAKLDFSWGPSLRLYGTLLLALHSPISSHIQKIRLSQLPDVEHTTLLDNILCGPNLHSLLSISTCVEFMRETELEKNTGILLATSSGQLVQFDNYKTPGLSRSCKLPMNNATSFRFYNNPMLAEEYCIVEEQDGKPCVFILTTFQVVSAPDISHTTVGISFIHNGHLFRSCDDRQTPLEMTQFNIKDLVGCLRPEGEADKTNVGLTSAQKALQSGVVNGKKALSCALAETSALNKTVNELTHVLRSLTTGEEGVEKRHRSYVYGLLTGKQISMARNFSTVSEPLQCRTLDISSPWQKSVANTRIIGIDVANPTQKPVFDMTLLVTVPFRSFQHTSQFFLVDEKYRTASQSGEPLPKKLCLEHKKDGAASGDVRILEPGQSGILTVALGPKLLGHRSELQLNIAVASKQKDGDRTTSSCVGCLPVTVTMQDALNVQTVNLNVESEGKEALRDLAALNAYTDTVMKLVIVSKETKLVGILDLLQEGAGFSYHPYLDILFWKTSQIQCLNNAWLTLDRKGIFEAHLTIHARNRCRIFEMVHYLYGKLPADILILPDADEPPKALAQNLLEEANLVSGYLEIAAGAEPGQSQGVARASTNMDLDNYRNFRSQLFKLEQKTDASAANHS